MIFLKAPSHDPVGPDGKGWNRLRVDTLTGSDQCALRPKTAEKFVYESSDTRHARYGGFKDCENQGVCSSCPIYNEPLRSPLEGVERVMVRIDEKGRAWVMNRPEAGWSSFGYIMPWELLARIRSHVIETRTVSVDKHSRYFWLIPVKEESLQPTKEKAS